MSIPQLGPNDIFVFGSNMAGKHGAGAALTVRLRFGAIYGIPMGRQGQSYAIPTKDSRLMPLSLITIRESVDNFKLYAARHLHLEFFVTCIGCGLAGFKHEEIAPMFKDSPVNCLFDERWKPHFKGFVAYWGSFENN